MYACVCVGFVDPRGGNVMMTRGTIVLLICDVVGACVD